MLLLFQIVGTHSFGSPTDIWIFRNVIISLQD